DVVEIGEGEVRVAFEPGIRQQEHFRLAAVLVDDVYEAAGLLESCAIDIRCVDVVAPDHLYRHTCELAEFVLRHFDRAEASFGYVRPFAFRINPAHVLVRNDALDVVALERGEKGAKSARRVRELNRGPDSVRERCGRVAFELSVRDAVEFLVARAHGLIPGFAIVLRELNVVEPVRVGEPEAPRDEVLLVGSGVGRVRRLDTAPVGATDARSIPNVDRVAAPQEDTLKAFAAVPASLPSYGARAVPHQQAYRSGSRRNLILDHTVIAVKRRLGGIAADLPADGEGALALDEKRAFR